MIRELARHEYHRECLEYDEEIGDQMSCKKEKMWKPVCEVWYNEAPDVLEELNNSMPRKTKDLIKARGDTKKYCFYDEGVHCCVFIGMY